MRWPYKLVVGEQPYSVWTGELYPNCSTFDHFSAMNGPFFVDVRALGEEIHFGATPSETAKLTWAHNCGDAGCLVNLADDPTEHVDLALGADATHSKLRAELR